MESYLGTSPLLLPVNSKSHPRAHVKRTGPNIVGIQPLPYNIRKGELHNANFQSSPPHFRCAAALNVKCAAAASATQTVVRNSLTVTVTPGGLTLLGILGILGILKDIESDLRRKDRSFHGG